MPFDRDARARLRQQQKREQDLLSAVLAADTRLEAQRLKHRRSVERADQELSTVQTNRDDCVRDLLNSAGISRTAELLALPKSDLARLSRSGSNGGTKIPTPTQAASS
jgi:hypothetical protein